MRSLVARGGSEACRPGWLAVALLCAGLLTAARTVAGQDLRLGPGGRFRVDVRWHDPRSGSSGEGHPLPLTGDTGAFWFFSPDNIELVVKALDGRAVNGRFWIFAGGLTDVALELEVADTASGWTRLYPDPPFHAPQLLDTDAFDPGLLAGRLLWVGAHPDDEILAAPLLGELCHRPAAGCTLLVATRGEAGDCRLAGGCGGDLGALRVREMAASAAALGAGVVQWSLPDVAGIDPAGVRRAWAAAAGGDAALVERLAGEIAAADPDAVLLFDPRHGSTCHPAHRAVADLVLAALARLGTAAPAAALLETRPVEGPGTLGFAAAVPDDAAVAAWDGPATSPTGSGWGYVLAVAAAHASQFTAQRRAALAAAPPSERRVFVLPRRRFHPDPAYDALCAPAAPP